MDYCKIEDITKEEKEGIKELRKRVENEMSPELLKDNTVFIRYLRAREGNLAKATDMLRNHIEWRKVNDIDNIQDYKPPEAWKFFPTTVIGFDKLGSVIRYDDIGNFDVRGTLKSVKKEDLLMSIQKAFETDNLVMRQQSDKLGRTVSKWLHIANFENFTFTSATNKRALDFYVQLMKSYEANYPERLKTMYIINASVYFMIFFNVLKPFLTPITLKKVIIFGKDGWKEELLKVIDADVLPVFLGGTRKDENGDPMCNGFLTHGSVVPHSYYFRSDDRRLCCKPHIRKLIVSRMSKTNVELDVKKTGDFIEWEFETENGDIAFGLFLELAGHSEDTALKEIIPVQRVEAHIASETGTYRCEEPGKYVLQFDNSHSWMRRKEIFYRVEIVETNSIN